MENLKVREAEIRVILAKDEVKQRMFNRLK